MNIVVDVLIMETIRGDPMNKLKQAINNSPKKRKEICETVDISTTTLWNFENDKHTKTVDIIKGLCKVFDKKFEDLFY